MRTIVIDPGHGLPDPGAVGPTGLTEEAVVLDVSLRLAKLLEAAGVAVVLTRHDHNMPGGKPAAGMSLAGIRNIGLKSRVAAATLPAPALFVSVHTNAATTPAAHGYEVFHNRAGEEAALCMYDTMLVRLASHRPRRVLRADYYVLRKNTCPAILVELEFISNPQQEATFRDPAALAFYAKTLAAGIEAYLAQRPVS